MKEKESLQDIALNFINNRSEKSFTKLYHRIRPGLFKMTMKYHHDIETVNDILAITLAKAYTYASDYDDRWHFSTWIYKICQNECLMEIRRKNITGSLTHMQEANIVMKPLFEEDVQESYDYEFFDNTEVIESNLAYNEVMDEIEILPERYKNILQDREIRKLKYEEIATLRNININTVRSRIHVAKKLVKNRWIKKKRESVKGDIDIKNVVVIKANEKI